VALLGISEFTKWTLLVSLSSRFESPSELLVTALVRARTCENYARATGQSPDTAFIVGLLSVLDALLDRSMPDVLRELPLTEEICGAVLDLQGSAGRILERALAREQGSYGEDDDAEQTLTESWMEAVEWAEATRGAGLIG
jgi:EAL and modified HD-GYP domain-containing signal transduction protein